MPADNGVPNDLPPWARDELVRRRLEMCDLQAENMRLRVELVKARGGDVGEQLTAIIRTRW